MLMFAGVSTINACDQTSLSVNLQKVYIWTGMKIIYITSRIHAKLIETT